MKRGNGQCDRMDNGNFYGVYNGELRIENGFGNADHLARRAHQRAENRRMGGRVMVSVVKGMSGSLAGNHTAHDQKTGQDHENECCAGYTHHDIGNLCSSIEQDTPGVKNDGGLLGMADLLYSPDSHAGCGGFLT